MLQVAYAAVEEREYQTNVSGLPIAVGAGADVILSGLFVVPDREINQVIGSGGGLTVDSSLVTVTGAYLAVQSQSGSLVNAFRSNAGANYVNFGMVVPVQFSVINGLLRWVFSISLQGVVLMGGDNVLLFVNVRNSDAVTRNVTQFGWQTRVVPALAVTEQAVALLDGIRGDQSLNQRLLQRR